MSCSCCDHIRGENKPISNAIYKVQKRVEITGRHYFRADVIYNLQDYHTLSSVDIWQTKLCVSSCCCPSVSTGWQVHVLQSRGMFSGCPCWHMTSSTPCNS